MSRNTDRHDPISRGARAEECVLLNIATALVNAMSAALLALVSRRDAERAEVRTAPMGGGGSVTGHRPAYDDLVRVTTA